MIELKKLDEIEIGDDIWGYDLLKRKEFAELFIPLIKSADAPFVVALDTRYGEGGLCGYVSSVRLGNHKK